MSIQNRFAIWKQVEMKSQQRSSVFAVHSAAGWAEGSYRTTNLRLGQVNGCLLPYQLQAGNGHAPGKYDLEMRSWCLFISDGLLRFTALVLVSANKFMDRWVLGRLYHKDLGFLLIQSLRCLLQRAGFGSS